MFSSYSEVLGLNLSIVEALISIIVDLNGQNIKTRFDDISRITTCMIHEVSDNSDMNNEVVCRVKQ